MCLIYLAHRVHPVHRLVVAANRDEVHARASAPAHWWKDAPQVLAGRDLEGGGTWMGVSRCGRFAALTNYRESGLRRPDARTRGELVSGFLGATADAMSYLRQVQAGGERYNGFSLLVHDGQLLAWYSNRGPAPAVVAPGVHGLSNGLLDASWPKVEEGKLEMLALLARDALEPQHLLGLLDRREPAADARLPDSGIGLERERALSARFILGDLYGTRCSTFLRVSDGGQVMFHERSFDHRGEPRGDAVFEFTQCEEVEVQHSPARQARRPS